MQLTRNTLVPMAMGMLAIAAARAEAAPLAAPCAAANAAVRPAAGDVLLWGLELADRLGAQTTTIDEAAPAIPAMACLGEDADGAVAQEEECCGIVEAGWGGAEEVIEADGAGTSWIEEFAAETLAGCGGALDAPTLDAPTFEAPTFEEGGEPAAVPSVEVSEATLPIYVFLCQAVVDAVKSGEVSVDQDEEAPGVDESGEQADLVAGDACALDAGDLEPIGVDEQADLAALVSCPSDAAAAKAVAESLRRGVVRFFETLLRENVERPDASFAASQVIDEAVDAPAPAREYEEGHVPEVLTLF